MNKSIIAVIIIFLIPLALYWGITRDRLTTLPSEAATGAEVIRFSSPMCYDCQELDKVFKEVSPKYNKFITTRKIDVTNRTKSTNDLIEEFEVKLVPTTVFKKDGTVVRRIEGAIQPKILDNYLKEIING